MAVMSAPTSQLRQQEIPGEQDEDEQDGKDLDQGHCADAAAAMDVRERQSHGRA
jgi:hypothetical protein